MKVMDLVKIVFGEEITDDEADSIVYGCTGFPSFFKGDPVRCFYYQLHHARRALNRGFTVDDIYSGQDKIKQAEQSQ